MREENQWAPPSWLGEPTSTQAPPPLEAPFTLPAQEIPRELWLGKGPTREPSKPLRKPDRPPRSLAVALPVIIILGLLSTFFSWVSAEPLWLAVGHSSSGTATVTRCVGEGTTRRCLGDFHSRDFAVTRISLLGLTDKLAAPGSRVPAEMVNERSHRAYAGGSFLLRWLPGLLIVFLCGLGIFLITGVRRVADRRERLTALALSLGAPLLVTIGFLASAF